jgi:allose kinase
MSKRDVVIGVDIGGTHLRLGMVDRECNLLAVETRESALISDSREGPARLMRVLDEAIVAWGKEELRVAAMALGFPSTVSKDRRTIIQTPNLQGFDNVRITELLERRFHVPVVLEKDVNLLLKHDIDRLRLSTEGTILGFYIGTGLGNSIFMNNAFYTGKNGVAGELGHIPVRGASARCVCGNIGCVETVASGRRLQEIVEENYPGEDISGVFRDHGNEPVIRELLEWFSIPLAAEINLFDPDAVVIGGGVVRMEAFPFETLTSLILSHVRRPSPYQGLSVHVSPGNSHSGILGGASIAWERLASGG